MWNIIIYVTIQIFLEMLDMNVRWQHQSHTFDMRDFFKLVSLKDLLDNNMFHVFQTRGTYEYCK